MKWNQHRSQTPASPSAKGGDPFASFNPVVKEKKESPIKPTMTMKQSSGGLPTVNPMGHAS